LYDAYPDGGGMGKTATVATKINLAGLPRELNEALTKFIAQIEERKTPLNKPPQHRVNSIAYEFDRITRRTSKTREECDIDLQERWESNVAQVSSDIILAVYVAGKGRGNAINELDNRITRAFERYRTAMGDRINGVDLEATLRDLCLIGRAIAVKDLIFTSINPKEYTTRLVGELARDYGIRGSRKLLKPCRTPPICHIWTYISNQQQHIYI
jgi:hypothetical protein